MAAATSACATCSSGRGSPTPSATLQAAAKGRCRSSRASPPTARSPRDCRRRSAIFSRASPRRSSERPADRVGIRGTRGQSLPESASACWRVGDRVASDAWLAEASIASLQEEMAAGRLTAVDLVEMFMERIDALDRNGPTLRSVLEVNPDALEIARALDQERASRGARGPLHGIPILLKDSIDTADKMETTA